MTISKESSVSSGPALARGADPSGIQIEGTHRVNLPLPQAGCWVVGLDPGFASFGWTRCWVERQAGRLVCTASSVGVIRTKKEGAARHVYQADENLARARYINQQLGQVVGLGPPPCLPAPRAVCAEAMSFPRSASVAAKMALSWGLVVAAASWLGCPILQATPQRLKQQVAGRADASKQQVERAVRAACRVDDPRGWSGLLQGLPAGQHEHCFDACAAVLACLDSEAVGLLLG